MHQSIGIVTGRLVAGEVEVCGTVLYKRRLSRAVP